MNSISLAGERLQAELDRSESFDKAKIVALQAALIPITNSLFAVGFGFTSGDDDRSDPIRCFSFYCSQVSDHGDVHDVWLCGNFHCFVSDLHKKRF